MFAIGAVISGFAGSAVVVIVGRAVQGGGAAFVMPATLSLITADLPAGGASAGHRHLGRFAGAGAAIGPIVSGALLQRFWWGSAFLVNVPVVVVTAAAIALYSPPSRDDKPHRSTRIGAVLSLVGLGALLYGIIEGPERGWSDASCVGHVRRSPPFSSWASSPGSGRHRTRCCRCGSSPTAASASAAGWITSRSS